MNCKKVADLMSDYMDECLSDKMRVDLEMHMQECSRCKEDLRAMDAMLTNLRSLSGQRSPVNCWAGVRERIVERETSRLSWFAWILRPAIAAPVLALGLLLAVFLAWPSSIENTRTNSLVSDAEYSRYIGAHSNLQRQQAFADPDVTFITAELEKASLSGD